MALQIPLPAKVVAHAHWTMDKQKMSKSIGNVVNPFFALDRFGPDVMRFYLAYDGRIADDTDYDNFQIIARYKKVLAGGLGNLASRITRGKGWNLATIVEDVIDQADMASSLHTFEDVKMWRRLKFVHEKIEEEMQNYNIPEALHSIMHVVTEVSQQPMPDGSV
jgi:methionyl-tRNA synthetase